MVIRFDVFHALHFLQFALLDGSREDSAGANDFHVSLNSDLSLQCFRIGRQRRSAILVDIDLRV